ncbi:MAG TPA: hypothetical protein VNG31_05290 [Candidatus Baltobacteraceae bacterium]|nr:hypothetical protein [Candidatus Baltobacteraceae bacterium]
MKPVVTALVSGSALAALTFATALAAPPSLTGTWQIEQSGLNGNTTSTIKLTQSGTDVVGTSSNGNGFTGTFVTNGKMNAKWKGPGGAGWLTVYVTPNGHSMNGTWGYNGRPANGSFIGNKVLPPSPFTAAGLWNVRGAGGSVGFIGEMRCTQSGKAVVCHSGDILINGRVRTADKVRATWTGPNGSGWFSFWFNDDNNSFNGVWGNGADTTPPVGRVIGQRSLNP